MKFLRLAIIEFTSLRKVFEDKHLVQTPHVDVRLTRLKFDSTETHTYFALAETDARRAATIKDRALWVDDGMRLKCEELLEGVANICAVAYAGSRSIYSYFVPTRSSQKAIKSFGS